jgi:hypothetical protein
VFGDLARQAVEQQHARSRGLAHDNLMQRQHMPLNDRQHAEIDALLRENRWAAGELRPAQACRVAVLSVINPPHLQPPQLKEQEVGA